MKTFDIAILLATLAPNLCLAAGPFDGIWQNFQWWSDQRIEVCEVTVMRQRGNRVCGFWQNFASSHVYEGRFIANAKGNTLNWESECSDGRNSMAICPEPSIYSTENPKPADKIGWDSTNAKSLFCGGKVYYFGSGVVPGNCAVISKRLKSEAFTKKAATSKQNAPGQDPKEQEWIKSCLEAG